MSTVVRAEGIATGGLEQSVTTTIMATIGQ